MGNILDVTILMICIMVFFFLGFQAGEKRTLDMVADVVKDPYVIEIICNDSEDNRTPSHFFYNNGEGQQYPIED